MRNDRGINVRETLKRTTTFGLPSFSTLANFCFSRHPLIVYYEKNSMQQYRIATDMNIEYRIEYALYIYFAYETFHLIHLSYWISSLILFNIHYNFKNEYIF